MKLRIATYNIHKGVSTIGSRPRVHALKQALSTLNADIIFLQEVQGRHDLNAIKHAALWPTEAQHEYIAGIDRHTAYGLNAVYDHGHHGNALISNFPIASSQNRDVSDHAYESRGILHCVVQADGARLHCYVIHLGLFERSRRRQTEALIEAVRETAPADEPVIIAGDFNDWNNRLSDTLRECLGVTEVFDHRAPRHNLGSVLRQLSGRGPKLVPARTFPAAMPVLQLDRVYVRGFKVHAAKVLHGLMWSRLSDHAPIMADLELS